jgi:hypothetical protein
VFSADEVLGFENVALGGIKKEISTALSHLKTLYAVPHIEDIDGIDKQIEEIITQTEQLLSGTGTFEDYQQQLTNISNAVKHFLCNATPSDITKPFDLTNLLQNTGMDVNTGWSATPSIDHSTGEFYQATFDMNQVIRDIPAGTYQFCAQTFHRPGTSTDSYNAYIKGTNNVSAYMYAGAKSQKVMHIAECAQATKVGIGNESTVGSPARYMPNDRNSARAYFDKGLYENKVTTTVDSDGGLLKIGIRSGNMASNYWCCFDNFRLYFYGNISLDEVNAIEEVNISNNKNEKRYIYTLDGRRLPYDTATLKPGIYIINGKKVVK